MEQITSILYSALVIWITATLVLLAYSFRSNKADFDIKCWYATNTNRFIVGAIMIVGLSILLGVSEDITAILRIIGLSADKSPIGLGLAIGAFLIAGVSGNPAEKGKTNEENLN